MKTSWIKLSVVALAAAILFPAGARAHCDRLDGPVVAAAKQALEKGDVTPVLKWVKPEQEAEIRSAFRATQAVRGKGPEARELADRYFFETLVRVHRAGEGAPYDGLKPGGGPLPPGIAAADRALEQGEIDHLVTFIAEQASRGIRERFEQALHRKKRADASVEAGREFVEAYVEFIHYVERVAGAISGPAAPHAH